MGPTYAQLLQVTDLFYHSSCPDGTAAAMICAAGFRSSGMALPKFHSLQYGTEFMEKLEPRPGQLFVDITPPKDRWREWLGVTPVVLDHHESVKEVTEGLGGVYGLNETHSGAMLAFDHVYSVFEKRRELEQLVYDSAVPRAWKELATLAMIRDTWKKSSERWQDACAQAMALQTYGSGPMVEKVLETGAPPELLELGRVLLRSATRKAEKIADSSYLTQASDGDKSYKIGFFNCTEAIISDVANTLIDRGQDVAVGYFYMFEDGTQKISVSIRTNGSVSALTIAKTFGGGGHERAAGFRIDGANDTPPASILAYIEQGMAAARLG